MKHGGNVWGSGAPEDWLDFSANLRPEGPPEWVRQTILSHIDDIRYYPDRSMRSAREGLSEWLKLPPENILPTSGGINAIDLYLKHSSGRVIIRNITFGEYADRAGQNQREVCPEGTVPEAGDTLVLCNPNNPTGEVLSRETVLSLHQKAKSRSAELMVDEAFIDFCPANSVRDAVCGSLATVGSLTKLLGIPGIRLGYICASQETIAGLERSLPPWNLNTMAALIAAEIPRHSEEIAQDIRRNRDRREEFASALQQLGVAVYPSAANFLLVDFRRNMESAVGYLKENHILVRTCGSFGLPENFLRLGVKTSEENSHLIEVLKLWPGF